MDVTIRQASAPDAEAISRMIMGLSSRFLADPASPGLKPFLDTLTPAATAARIVAPDYDYYVAESGAGICGVAALRDGSHL